MNVTWFGLLIVNVSFYYFSSSGVFIGPSYRHQVLYMF